MKMMYGKGLLDGLALTFKKIFTRKVTEQYPDERPFIDHRWRGSFQLDTKACICCGMCANACPNRAITLEVGKDETNRRFLSRYEINFERCLVCGLCVEACTQNCLRFTREFEVATYFREDVLLDLLKRPNLEAPASRYAKKEAAPEEV